ncbi:hypothetical protein [Rhodoferax aquaticus]|uniref:DUF3828 domain-containing protein n=1 Tax=Rhodoferax aquaticus TaxID=2527691 RepID=A0A515EU16_9BURK|nr:hypothetical protein [Rhodoferax aquaticus]QDL56174.1 hypothetical protein EXZ61_19535 [Rhodoferax aquaticus]
MMKKFISIAIACCALSISVFAGSLTSAQTEVKEFADRMYSYSANEFEGALFNGKQDGARNCRILKIFFIDGLLTPEDKKWRSCEVAGVGYLRYPKLGSYDFDLYGEKGAIKGLKIYGIQADGDKGTFTAETTNFGSVNYFLRKFNNQWKIVNASAFNISGEKNSHTYCAMIEILNDIEPWQLKWVHPLCVDEVSKYLKK